MDDLAVFLCTLSADIVLELFDPRFAFFPVLLLVCFRKRAEGALLSGIEHISQQHAAAGLVDADR